jgi:murein DD-endopeptidase MepM/ murein hydrolase activator NlpD
MDASRRRRSRTLALLAYLALLAGCVRPGPDAAIEMTGVTPIGVEAEGNGQDEAPVVAQLGTPLPTYVGVPTRDDPHYEIGGNAGSALTHIVAPGETLGIVAQQYATTIEELVSLNNLSNADLIQVGQQLVVPGQAAPPSYGPTFKIIPDSELVYGPGARAFDVRAFLESLDSVLLQVEEDVEGQMLSGPEIIQLVAERHSVNPRLLLAVLEYKGTWVTRDDMAEIAGFMGNAGPGSMSLYGQLSWAANQLNLGFYGRADGGLRNVSVAGEPVFFDPTINHGTAGVQQFLSAGANVTVDGWTRDAGPDGLYSTYEALFGSPFAYAIEPLLPADLQAQALLLPWAPGETWYYTSGPHGAWNSGSAWGALDFAPPGEQLGCVQSDAWVTAMAGGLVVRSGFGAVVVDLDGDGDEGTGWAHTYMHLETRDRVAEGTTVEAGDRLGHPSCEGGFSNGTHLHIVRSYNGRWISADGDLPFNLSGWVSQGLGSEYDGLLVRGDETREACACRDPINAITH